MDKLTYQQAESFLPWNLQKSVFNSTIFPYWSKDVLYYFQQTEEGKNLLRVDMVTGKEEKISDYQQILAALTHQVKNEIDSVQLPLNGFTINENPLRLFFKYQDNCWSYDLKEHTCQQEEKIVLGELKSPDNKWALAIENHNLVVINIKENQYTQLTTDSKPYYDYASSPETNTRAVSQRLENAVVPPVALWSPDSHKIVTHKLDQRKVSLLYLLQNAPHETQRPVLHTYRMSFSGDTHLPLAELIIVDIVNKTITPFKIEPFLSPYLTPLEYKWVWWSHDSKKIYFLREDRASKKLMLCMTDANTGNTEVLISEIAKTYVEPSQNFLWSHQVIILEDSQEIIWLSERSGYAHVYLYAMGENILKHTITQGEWCVREVHFYDANSNWLYFTACGFYETNDPYYKQLFRCHLDGSEMQCLTPENSYHSICISPYKNCFLDTYSSINTAPISLLKSMDGTSICHVETANMEGLKKLNWVPPERVCLKARDGITSIYGNLYFPSHFDSNKEYPIIDHIYPGPQVYRTSAHFSIYGAIFRSAWIAQALAELGFIVIHIDGFGTPGRSKAFHDATYQNIGDCGIPDHISAIKQLSKSHRYIDIDRVGITGYSGGAYAAARAILMYPDFFKVAVAAAGNHDLRCYLANYGEKYNGLDVSTYVEQSNAAHADKLQGKLLLIHGEMDDNVHPCATLQLVDALINHNKDFDMLIMPNQNHGSTFDHPYYTRRHWDYFVRHLLGEMPPANYSITPMQSEFPQLIDW